MSDLENLMNAAANGSIPSIQGPEEIIFVSVSEGDMPTIKAKPGYDLVKVGKVSKDKVSAWIGKYAFMPAITHAELKEALGEMGTEAATILHQYFTDARSAYVRDRIIEGLNQIPASLVQFSKRSLWLAFNGVSSEAAAMFVAQVIQTRCEEFSFIAAAKKMGFAGLDDVPEERNEELIRLQGSLMPTFVKAASSPRNVEFLTSLVAEGRILSRYSKFSEAQCTEGIKWMNGVENPIAAQVTSLLTSRIEAIHAQVALVGMDSAELSVMAEYFKSRSQPKGRNKRPDS